MVSAARQLCRGSNSVGTTLIVTACPVCSTKVSPSEKVWMQEEGTGERVPRPVIPPHVRNERGEIETKLKAESKRYPGT